MTNIPNNGEKTDLTIAVWHRVQTYPHHVYDPTYVIPNVNVGSTSN